MYGHKQIYKDQDDILTRLLWHTNKLQGKQMLSVIHFILPYAFMAALYW